MDDVALGLALPADALAGDLSGTENPVYALAGTVGGLALAVIGLDYLRGGEWLDIPDSLD